MSDIREKLKPCPSCGSDAKEIKGTEGVSGRPIYGVYCPNCQLRTWGSHKRKGEAISVWNNRIYESELSALQEENERLRKSAESAWNQAEKAQEDRNKYGVHLAAALRGEKRNDEPDDGRFEQVRLLREDRDSHQRLLMAEIDKNERLRKTIFEARDQIANSPIDCLGSGYTSDGEAYPIRDEMVHRFTEALQEPTK